MEKAKSKVDTTTPGQIGTEKSNTVFDKELQKYLTKLAAGTFPGGVFLFFPLL